MTSLFVLFAASLGCSAPTPPAPPKVIAHRAAGVSVGILENSRVQQSPTGLKVDAADGMQWFDVQWVDKPVVPHLAATTWADGFCRPMMWDDPARPIEGTWTSGGICTVGGRRHWAFVALEDHGDRTLLMGYVARKTSVKFEDAWVNFLRTAASVTGAVDPLDGLAEESMRARLRDLPVPDGARSRPVPGGGLLSGMASAAFTDVWTARRGQPVPTFGATTSTADAGEPAPAESSSGDATSAPNTP